MNSVNRLREQLQQIRISFCSTQNNTFYGSLGKSSTLLTALAYCYFHLVLNTREFDWVCISLECVHFIACANIHAHPKRSEINSSIVNPVPVSHSLVF